MKALCEFRTVEHYLLLQREENEEMVERINHLNVQCQKHEANWIVVDDCLSAIEKDSSLSEVSKEALQRARQRITDSVASDVKTKVFKMQNIGAWLHAADFRAVVRQRLFAMNIKQT